MPLVRHLGALYEGIDDTDAIRFFLERARIKFRASNEGYVWIDRRQGSNHYLNVGIPDEMQAGYVAVLDQDPWVRAGLRRPDRRFVVTSD